MSEGTCPEESLLAGLRSVVMQLLPYKADIPVSHWSSPHEKEPQNSIHSCAGAQLRRIIARVRAE